MPGYFIYEYTETPFDNHTFTIKAGSGTKGQAEEGHKYEFRYT